MNDERNRRRDAAESDRRRRSSQDDERRSRRSADSTERRVRDDRMRDPARRREIERRRKAAEKKRKAKKRRRIFLGILLVLLLLSVVGCFGALKLFEIKSGQSLSSCISEGKAIAAASTKADFEGGYKSYIYAADGTEIAELSLNNESVYLTYDQIPKAVVDAFVAIEDRTFWTNDGTDPKGMARILVNFVMSGGKKANGASTITQQLVKLTYLSAEKTLSRKVKEIIISRDITKKYSKEEIITFYCNACCFANGIYGISDAAEAYFGKTPDQLTLSECAYLCAIPNRPEYYNPKTNPDNALDRRDKILRDMNSEGYITDAEMNQALQEKIVISGKTEDDEDYNYETTYAINCAAKYIMGLQDFEFRYQFTNADDYKSYQDEYSEAYKAAKHELYTGGYKIYTTIDRTAQRQMQQILDEELAEKDAKLDTGIYQVQGAMTVIDNQTGKVVAVIGGRSQDEIKGNYTLNRAFQGNAQPGSSIKPLIVYTPALDTGEYTTGSYLQNIDVTKAKEDNLSADEIAEMEGDEVTLGYAVEQSLNGCAYWLFANIGVRTGIQYIQNMNFEKIVPGDYNMSACLGGLNYGVTTEEMANAYYTLENGGTFRDTDCIDSIIDRLGHNIYQEPKEKDVYSTEATQRITAAMKRVLTDGTAARSDWYEYTDIEAAGKTGTTNDNKAGWFCGYTPYYTISVWVGCDTPTVVNGLSGASYPLSIWERAMLTMIDGMPAAYLDVIEDEEEEYDEPECICSSRCSADHVNENCPVCSNDYYECTAREETCICSEKCFGDSLNEQCPVCLRDVSSCTGQELTCICDDKCSADHIDSDCKYCVRDYTACRGNEQSHETDPTTEPETEETTPEETTPEETTEHHEDEGDDEGEDPPEPEHLEEHAEE